MDERSGVDPQVVATLWEREIERYAREHPRCLELRESARSRMPHGVPMSWMASYFAHPPVWIDEGHGAHFTCVDGVRFLDTNVGDKSTFCGIDPEPVVRAVQQRVANGSQFMLPTEDAIVVADQLARALGPARLAVHAVGVAGQHGGAPPRPARHRPAQGPHLHRQLRRPRRRDARRLRRRGAALVPGPRPRRRRRHPGRAVQRCRRGWRTLWRAASTPACTPNRRSPTRASCCPSPASTTRCVASAARRARCSRSTRRTR